MQAYGSDRLRQDGDRWILSSRFEKGWIPRVEKTLTTAEFPGTAVLCDDQYYECVAVQAIPNGVRYILEPWRDHLAMRTSDRYDAESEAARMEHRRSVAVRERKRHTINLLGIFAGHLPGDVQEKIGLEYGIYAHWLTLMSCFANYVLVAVLMLLATNKFMEGAVPATLFVIAAVLLFETILRMTMVLARQRPMGSFVGLLAYTIYATATGTLVVSDLPKIPDAPEHIARQDALAMREPLVTLLPPRDQHRIAARFGYRYEHLSAKVAATILIFAILGTVTAAHERHIAGALVAAAVAAEQIYRLSAFHRGPAGSVFGYLVRPAVRKLL